MCDLPLPPAIWRDLLAFLATGRSGSIRLDVNRGRVICAIFPDSVVNSTRTGAADQHGTSPLSGPRPRRGHQLASPLPTPRPKRLAAIPVSDDSTTPSPHRRRPTPPHQATDRRALAPSGTVRARAGAPGILTSVDKDEFALGPDARRGSMTLTTPESRAQGSPCRRGCRPLRHRRVRPQPDHQHTRRNREPLGGLIGNRQREGLMGYPITSRTAEPSPHRELPPDTAGGRHVNVKIHREQLSCAERVASGLI
jgi:hypothetical protein